MLANILLQSTGDTLGMSVTQMAWPETALGSSRIRKVQEFRNITPLVMTKVRILQTCCRPSEKLIELQIIGYFKARSLENRFYSGLKLRASPQPGARQRHCASTRSCNSGRVMGIRVSSSFGTQKMESIPSTLVCYLTQGWNEISRRRTNVYIIQCHRFESTNRAPKD